MKKCPSILKEAKWIGYSIDLDQRCEAHCQKHFPSSHIAAFHCVFECLSANGKFKQKMGFCLSKPSIILTFSSTYRIAPALL